MKYKIFFHFAKSKTFRWMPLRWCWFVSKSAKCTHVVYRQLNFVKSWSRTCCCFSLMANVLICVDDDEKKSRCVDTSRKRTVFLERNDQWRNLIDSEIRKSTWKINIFCQKKIIYRLYTCCARCSYLIWRFSSSLNTIACHIFNNHTHLNIFKFLIVSFVFEKPILPNKFRNIFMAEITLFLMFCIQFGNVAPLKFIPNKIFDILDHGFDWKSY